MKQYGTVLASIAGLALAVAPILAHHSESAQYDEKKPVTLKGVVTRFEWNNPHVSIYIDVAASGGELTHWLLEFPSTIELRRAGWTRELINVGDPVTFEGILARDGSKQASARTITLASGRKLAGVAKQAALPKATRMTTPRWPDGHPRFNPLPGETGYWSFPSQLALVESNVSVKMNSDGILANIADAGKVAPLQPWAKGLYEYRQKTLLRDDPMTYCLPPGGPRQFHTANGLFILEEPERKRIFFMSGGGNRNWRMVMLDGRPLPNVENETPGYFGFSTGRWAGDTLNITSTGYNERFWFSNGGLPHTESLKLTEKFSRPDFDTLKYEVNIDDAGAYTRPWNSGWTLRWVAGEEIPEYFCDDNNRNPYQATK